MLNKEQQSVVESSSARLLVLAGAGAGKTHTMLERINRLVRDGVSPREILVLTFTNAAAFEMRERYKINHTSGLIPEFRTFHSFCYDLIIKNSDIRAFLGYKQVPTVPSDSKLKRIETEVKMMCNMNLSENKLSGKEKLSLKEEQTVQIYKKCLKKTLKKNNWITFAMLANEVSELFIKNSALVDRYKTQYKHIFVDEFQDTDPDQIRFLNTFEQSNFCCIGDCLQNLYSFRGCTNDTIKELSKDDRWEKIRLYQNYRSTNQICDFANKMSTYADKDYRIEMKGQRDGENVKVIGGAMSDWKHPVDVYHLDRLVDMLKEDETSKSIAVLCRTNKEVRHVCEHLNKNGVLYSTGNRNRDALHILKSVSDNDYMLDWLSSFLVADKYAEFIRLSSQEENPDIFWFSKEYGKLPEISERGKAIVEVRKILNSKQSPSSKVISILGKLGIKSGLVEMIETEEEILPYLIEIIEYRGDQCIYVGTIHSSKGLEYDKVYIMGVDDFSFQLKTEDMYNLYYVAITRARDNLVVFKK